MFLLLGLLVNPSQIWADAVPAFLIALFLIFLVLGLLAGKGVKDAID